MALRAIVGTSVPTAAYRASALHDSCATNRTAWLRAGAPAPAPGGLPVPAGARVACPRPSAVCGPASLRSAFCPLRVRPCAGAPAPARVRSGAGRPPLVAPPSARPPGSPARPLVRRCRGSAGSRWPRFPPGSPSLRCGLPVRSAFLLLRLPSGSPRVPRRAPPGPCRSAASGGSLGLRPRRWAPARGPARPSGPLVSGLRPPGSPARAGLPALASSGGGSSGGGFFRPLPSPSGGARSLRRLRPRGGSRFSRPSPRVPRAASRPPVRPPGLG